MFYLLMGRNLLKKIVKYSMCLVLEKWKYRQLNGAGRKKLFYKKSILIASFKMLLTDQSAQNKHTIIIRAKFS